MDAVIFPSMLECFSATPLEAMIMRKPLFASNMTFNHNICLDYAFYFDPHSAESAADAIGKYFHKASSDSKLLTAAYWHALNFSNPKDRALKYCDLMVDFSS
jgi:glycosyltransferase involved in cell wall biosynthesis